MAQMPREKADVDQAPFFSLFPYGSLSRRLAEGRSNGRPSGGMVGGAYWCGDKKGKVQLRVRGAGGMCHWGCLYCQVTTSLSLPSLIALATLDHPQPPTCSAKRTEMLMPHMAILIGQWEGSSVEQPPNPKGTEVMCCNHSWKLCSSSCSPPLGTRTLGGRQKGSSPHTSQPGVYSTLCPAHLQLDRCVQWGLGWLLPTHKHLWLGCH